MEHLTTGDGLAIFGVCGTIIAGIIAYVTTYAKGGNQKKKNNKNCDKTEKGKAEQALELGKAAATEILCQQRFQQNHELIKNLSNSVRDNGKKLDILIRDISLIGLKK